MTDYAKELKIILDKYKCYDQNALREIMLVCVDAYNQGYENAQKDYQRD